jgi:hypothetical protein
MERSPRFQDESRLGAQSPSIYSLKIAWLDAGPFMLRFPRPATFYGRMFENRLPQSLFHTVGLALKK